MDKKESRNIDLKLQVEERDQGTGKIYGYAAVFNSDSENMGFVERIKPGAFGGALKRSKDVVALFNHDINQIFGRRGINLDLREDEKGLWMEAAPVDTPTFSSVAANVRSGLVTKQSFSFTVAKDEWTDIDTDLPKRLITEVAELWDVGPVVSPAYHDTSVAMRSLQTLQSAPEAKIVEIYVGDKKISPTERGFEICDDVDKIIIVIDGQRYVLRSEKLADGRDNVIDNIAELTLKDVLRGFK